MHAYSFKRTALIDSELTLKYRMKDSFYEKAMNEEDSSKTERFLRILTSIQTFCFPLVTGGNDRSPLTKIGWGNLTTIKDMPMLLSS